MILKKIKLSEKGHTGQCEKHETKKTIAMSQSKKSAKTFTSEMCLNNSFANEIRNLRLVSHRNVVKFFGVRLEPELADVTEYVEG